MKTRSSRRRESITQADRAWFALGCTLCGVLLAALAWLLVGAVLQDFTPRWPAFAFAAGLSGLAGLIFGPALADVFAALVVAAYAAVAYQAHGPLEVGNIRLPQLRLAAIVFAALLLGGTIVLSLP